jgi:hypothetical protein
MVGGRAVQIGPPCCILATLVRNGTDTKKESDVKLVTDQIEGFLSGGAWIRKIFEQGLELKKKYGEDAVCDFSLGNPDLPPPPVVGECLADLACRMDKPFSLGYMPNPGYPEVRVALAAQLSKEQGLPIASSDLLLTCGAAGGINVFFRAVLTPGDEDQCRQDATGRHPQGHPDQARHLRAGHPGHGGGHHPPHPGAQDQFAEQSHRPRLWRGRPAGTGGHAHPPH